MLTGILAALIVVLSSWLQAQLPSVFLPMMVPGAAAVAMLLQKFVLDPRQGSKSYDGMADLFIHIHSPSHPDSALRWAVRGLNSLLLAVCGGLAGPEGAAVELSHAAHLAARPRSARWFEQRRRSDAAVSLSAGVSAAFGAPFAGLLLPTEFGLGGRTILSVVAALIASLAGKQLRGFLGIALPDFSGAVSNLGFFEPRAWIAALTVGLLAGLVGAALIRFFRYAQDSLLDLFQVNPWMRTLCAGVLLFLVVLTYRAAHLPSASLFEQAVWVRYSAPQALMLFLAGTLSLSMVLAGFGTVGVFWPILVLGSLFGAGLSGLFTQWASSFSSVIGICGFAGASAFWGALLGAPVAGAVMALELTQNVNVLLPCLVAAAAAHSVRRMTGARPLIQSDLEARGAGLVDGRSANVLSAISVSEAMVADHEIVSENEPVSEIYPRLLKSRYPFLPVVNSQNLYIGLLTVDLIQEAWNSQSGGHSNSPLSRLLEVKDLLYRGGLKGPTIRVNDRLSSTTGVFEAAPCIPVLSDDGRVMGLLFVHNVRLAYDREMARRSLVIE